MNGVTEAETKSRIGAVYIQTSNDAEKGIEKVYLAKPCDEVFTDAYERSP